MNGNRIETNWYINLNNFFYCKSNNPLNIISTHLRKYSHSLIVMTEGNKMPSLKAEFVCKYDKCKFPIGVRPCMQRNWLIVCDSGADMVKIFDKKSGELLHEITNKNDNRFSFKRPSAVLINYENNREIFVKDDKGKHWHFFLSLYNKSENTIQKENKITQFDMQNFYK